MDFTLCINTVRERYTFDISRWKNKETSYTNYITKCMKGVKEMKPIKERCQLASMSIAHQKYVIDKLTRKMKSRIKWNAVKCVEKSLLRV